MNECDPVIALNDHQSVLDKCTLLNGLTSSEMHAFLNRVQIESFQPGEEILTEGKQYQGLWIGLSGVCEVVKKGAKKDSRLALLEPGSVFGEMSFFDEVTHSASVRAVDHVETIRVLRDQYDDLCALCPSSAQKISVNIVRILADRLRRMDEWTCALVEERGDGVHHKEWQEFRSKLYTGLFE
ncbi:Crp/Fnr family transcriptional regulator [Planctomicrobium sp. SH668]|uniref:Crp/Fnr family transcriptional regulator n=1 Tax=Planctomicrobium sp. SH668 TaxID=3448126 RepID=UPI003F5C039D